MAGGSTIYRLVQLETAVGGQPTIRRYSVAGISCQRYSLGDKSVDGVLCTSVVAPRMLAMLVELCQQI